MKDPKDYEISVKKASEWTEKWRDKHPECKAFLIPTEDLMGVLTEMGVLQKDSSGNYSYHQGHKRDVRGYMGINPIGDDGKPEYKFVMVATEKFKDSRFKGGFVYRDIYNGGVDGGFGEVISDDDPGGSGVFDFSEPCPDMCDDQSELNGGG